MNGRTFVPSRSPGPVLGVRALGLKGVGDAFTLATRISKGFSASTVQRLARELGLPDKQILSVANIPESTFHARKRDRRPLTPEASSRIYRIAKATEVAESYFEGDRGAARRWLTQPKTGLGGAAPLEFARSPEGSDYVIDLLERMEHGVIS